MITSASQRSRPAVSSPSPEAPTGASSCQACPVRHYCALYVPQQVGIPADCPFGPGPTAVPGAARPAS